MSIIKRIVFAAACLLTLSGTTFATPLLIGTSYDLLNDSNWIAAITAEHQNNGNGNGNGKGNANDNYSYALNDDLFNVNWLADIYSEETPIPEDQLSLLGKYDNGVFNLKDTDYDLTLTVSTYEDQWYNYAFPYLHAPENTQGHWTLESDSFSGPVFFSVKTGNDFALYYAEDWSESDWNTFDLAMTTHYSFCPPFIWNVAHQMSHISFWTTGSAPTPDTPNPVPEPATLILLGMGAIGLSRTARKSFS